jgi:hypothetical protein
LPLEFLKSGAQALVVEAEVCAQLGAREGPCGRELREDGVVGGVSGIDGGAGFAIGDFEVCAGSVWARDEADGERLDGLVEAVLQGELQGVGTAGEVGVAVTPGVEVTRPAEGLSLGATSVLPDVVDEDDGEVVVSLEQARSPSSPDVGGAVLVAPGA